MKTKSYVAILFWILIVFAAFWKNYTDETRAHEDLAYQTARAFFNQIVIDREWNARHGGVYVRVTRETQPNPYLNDPLRDIETKQGMKLTKINPAFMTRQIAEIAALNNGARFHITSLKPIRPENKPSDWESSWLKDFEKGVKEQGGFFKEGSDVSFRYMAPLVTTNSCLQCHAEQGYKEGDIRGGISVILPFFPQSNYWSLILFYASVAVVVSLIILIASHLLEKKDAEQQDLIKNLQRALTEIKTLRGIVPICSFCKKIRDDKGYWSQVEAYVSQHTDAKFSHGVCPECMEKHYLNNSDDDT
jgi:Protein of unknown function (DUF3365)